MKENVIELKNVRKEFVTTKHYPGFKGAVKGLFTKEKMRKIAVTDYLGIDNYQKIRKQWKIDRMPYYVLINRKGQIIDFGTAARPSNPQLVSRIEEAVK